MAVLVCGDGDFVPMVEFAKEKGLRVEVIGFRESTSKNLIDSADSFFDLSSNPNQFLIKDTPRGRSPQRKVKIIS